MAGVVHKQAVKRIGMNIRVVLKCFIQQFYSFLNGKKGLFFVIDQNRDPAIYLVTCKGCGNTKAYDHTYMTITDNFDAFIEDLGEYGLLMHGDKK